MIFTAWGVRVNTIWAAIADNIMACVTDQSSIAAYKTMFTLILYLSYLTFTVSYLSKSMTTSCLPSVLRQFHERTNYRLVYL